MSTPAPAPNPVSVVNLSGYPLQIAIAKSVNDENRTHGWRVIYEEHAWRNRRDDSSGYVDLVLEHSRLDVVLLVECKRLQNRDWIFLPQNGNARPRRHARGFLAQRGQDGRLLPVYPAWTDQALDPSTPEAMFCVMPGDNRNVTVERVASELVSAAEAIADEEGDAFMSRRGGPSRRVYFAAIVTTAQLAVCEFEPAHISLEEGTIPNGNIQRCTAVRLTKQLSTRPPVIFGAPEFGREPTALADAKDQTVFVISAPRLYEFLRGFNVDTRGEAASA